MNLPRFFGYVVTGGSAAVIDLGGFLLLLHLGVPLVAASVLSFVAAALWNYALSSRYVFGHERSLRDFVRFFLIALVGLTINTAITWAATRAGFHPALAKIAAIGIAFIFNYWANASFVFSEARRSR